MTAAPGTTRDVLRERIEIDGLPLHVLDTAGLRAAADDVEREGIRRAERGDRARRSRAVRSRCRRIADAVAAARGDLAALPAGLPATVVINKIDLIGELGPRRGRRAAGAVRIGVDRARVSTCCARISSNAWAT